MTVRDKSRDDSFLRKASGGRVVYSIPGHENPYEKNLTAAYLNYMLTFYLRGERCKLLPLSRSKNDCKRMLKI